MEMENPAARRRVNVITAHFTTTTAYDHTPLFPMVRVLVYLYFLSPSKHNFDYFALSSPTLLVGIKCKFMDLLIPRTYLFRLLIF